MFHVTSQVVGSNMFYATIQKMGIGGVDEVDIHASILRLAYIYKHSSQKFLDIFFSNFQNVVPQNNYNLGV